MTTRPEDIQYTFQNVREMLQQLTAESLQTLARSASKDIMIADGIEQETSISSRPKPKRIEDRIEFLNNTGSSIPPNSILAIRTSATLADTYGPPIRVEVLNTKGSFVYATNEEDEIANTDTGWLRIISEHPVLLRYNAAAGTPKIGHPVGSSGFGDIDIDHCGLVCVTKPDTTNNLVWVTRGFDQEVYGELPAQINPRTYGLLDLLDNLDGNMVDPSTGSSPFQLRVYNPHNATFVAGCRVVARPTIGGGFNIYPAFINTSPIVTDFSDDTCGVNYGGVSGFIASCTRDLTPIAGDVFTGQIVMNVVGVNKTFSAGPDGVEHCEYELIKQEQCIISGGQTANVPGIMGSIVDVIADICDSSGTNKKKTVRIATLCSDPVSDETDLQPCEVEPQCCQGWETPPTISVRLFGDFTVPPTTLPLVDPGAPTWEGNVTVSASTCLPDIQPGFSLFVRVTCEQQGADRTLVVSAQFGICLANADFIPSANLNCAGPVLTTTRVMNLSEGGCPENCNYQVEVSLGGGAMAAAAQHTPRSSQPTNSAIKSNLNETMKNSEELSAWKKQIEEQNKKNSEG